MSFAKNVAEQGDSKSTNPSSPCFSFPKDKRLLSASEFSYVFSKAPYKASHSSLLILAKPSPSGFARLGLVIAKKHVRHAVQRNRVKRLIRESFRAKQHNLPPIDAIVLARRGLDAMNNQEINSVLDNLWKRVAKQATKPEKA